MRPKSARGNGRGNKRQISSCTWEIRLAAPKAGTTRRSCINAVRWWRSDSTNPSASHTLEDGFASGTQSPSWNCGRAKADQLVALGFRLLTACSGLAWTHDHELFAAAYAAARLLQASR